MKQSTIYNQTKSGQLKLLSYGENKFSLAGKFIFTKKQMLKQKFQPIFSLKLLFQHFNFIEL